MVDSLMDFVDFLLRRKKTIKYSRMNPLQKKIVITKLRIENAKESLDDTKRNVDEFVDSAISYVKQIEHEEKQLVFMQKQLDNCHASKQDLWKELLHITRSSIISAESNMKKCLKIVDELKFELLKFETKIERLESNLDEYESKLNNEFIVIKTSKNNDEGNEIITACNRCFVPLRKSEIHQVAFILNDYCKHCATVVAEGRE